MSVRNFRQLLPLYLACYALWIGLSALGVWLIFAVRLVLVRTQYAVLHRCILFQSLVVLSTRCFREADCAGHRQ